jgi:hypothetical protein
MKLLIVLYGENLKWNSTIVCKIGNLFCFVQTSLCELPVSYNRPYLIAITELKVFNLHNEPDIILL